MRTVSSVACALAVFLVVTVAGQPKPDFSGTWTAVASTARADGATLTVVQDAASITVSSPGTRGETNRVSLKLDGSPGKYGMFRPDGTIQEHEAKAEWADGKLVIALKAYSNGEGAYTVKQTWSMDGERLLVESVAISDTTGKPLSSPGTTTYKKN
jgi:hypothetical protein